MKYSIINNESKSKIMDLEILNIGLCTTNPDVEIMIQRKIDKLWKGTDRKYIHLIDTPNWLIVTEYDIFGDSHNRVLDVIVNNNDKFILIKSENDLSNYKLNGFKFVRYYDDMEYWIPYLVESEQESISRNEAYGISLERHVLDITEEELLKQRPVFSETVAIQMAKLGYNIISKKINRLDKTSLILVRKGENIYELPITDGDSKHDGIKSLIMEINKMVKVEDAFKVGDLVTVASDGDGVIYIIKDIQYASPFDDISTQNITLINIKTLSELRSDPSDILLYKNK